MDVVNIYFPKDITFIVFDYLAEGTFIKYTKNGKTDFDKVFSEYQKLSLTKIQNIFNFSQITHIPKEFISYRQTRLIESRHNRQFATNYNYSFICLFDNYTYNSYKLSLNSTLNKWLLIDDDGDLHGDLEYHIGNEDLIYWYLRYIIHKNERTFNQYYNPSQTFQFEPWLIM